MLIKKNYMKKRNLFMNKTRNKSVDIKFYYVMLYIDIFILSILKKPNKCIVYSI